MKYNWKLLAEKTKDILSVYMKFFIFSAFVLSFHLSFLTQFLFVAFFKVFWKTLHVIQLNLLMTSLLRMPNSLGSR